MSDTSTTTKPEDVLADGCPNCQAKRSEAPEGVDINGNPAWIFDYCWRCGFRPKGDNSTVDEERQMYEAFKKWQAEQMPQHPSLTAPDDGEVQRMRDEMAALQAELSRYKSNADTVTAPANPFSPSTNPAQVSNQPPSQPATAPENNG